MTNYNIPRIFSLKDVPEFKRFQDINPHKYIDEAQTAVMFSRAIHWMSIFEILWPNFKERDYYFIELATIVHNDPDKLDIPLSFYKQLAYILSTFWTIQLEDLYPDGEWTVKVWDDDEMTVAAEIHRKG